MNRDLAAFFLDIAALAVYIFYRLKLDALRRKTKKEARALYREGEEADA